MENKKSGNKKQIVILLLVIVIILVLFAVLVDIPLVLSELANADPRYVALASAALICGLIAYAVRWRALLGNKPPLIFTFHAANLGHAGNIIIPFRAGEVIRILVMGRSEIVSYTEATTSIVVERLFEQLMRILTFVLAIIVGVGFKVTIGSVIGGVGFLVLGFGAIAWLIHNQEFTLEKGSAILGRLPRVSPESARHSLKDLLDNLKLVSKPRQFGFILFFSFITWAFFWAFFYLTFLALSFNLGPGQQFAVSLGALALSPPSAPTQPGLFHASIVVPLTALGFNAEMLTAYAILLHIQEMFWVILLGIWALIATGLSLGAIREQL